MKREIKIIFALAALALVSMTNYAVGAERNYGSFVLDTDIPDTLFFLDEIRSNDSFELRKALRNHDIKNIVLASPGGNVWEALNMAGIIFDKKLRTFIPSETDCESACAFLFFAGHERLARGKLGVHQAYSRNYKEKKSVGQTQFTTQFTVSEIIGFLNEFKTPAFVFERMFQDIEMYYFDPTELRQLNSLDFTLSNEVQTLLTNYSVQKLKEHKPLLLANKNYTRKELVTLIQKKLNELGCKVGVADGYWGEKTNNAAIKFAIKAGLPSSSDKLISQDFFNALEKAQAGFCDEPEAAEIIAFAESYEYSCNDGPKFKDVWSVLHHDAEVGVIHIINGKGDTLKLKYEGNRFTVNETMKGFFEINDAGLVQKFSYKSELCSNIIFQVKK